MTDDRHDERAVPAEAAPSLPPGPPPGPRDPGDAWAYGPDGQKAWGLFGAAGLLVDDGAGRVLLQHRVEWSHHGGTWGIPGGARHQGEDAVTGALRESAEEAGVPAAALRIRHTSVLDLGFWTYTTVVARAVHPFRAEVGDRESLALDWVPVDDVEGLPLHPGFGASWPALRGVLVTEPVVVVDAANVVGSVPDGWWRDRAGAAERLVDAIGVLAASGLAAAELGLGAGRWWPRWSVVLEGDARAARTDDAEVEVVRATGAGDDAIVESVHRAIARAAGPVVVVTADRGLRARVEALGASVTGPSWLRALIAS
ncbi:NUDIX hydrolase [Curtobacterium sp. MCBD17_019]|uniref:NUDIX hydrolase n=1 Tax=Curtobacterium sp. MCBD17_019 TaxID=2175669 RepID=UPI000DA86852|nr:NUDIX hydrolase [Curtobacterium sp. MCBD17_019]PZE76696.1 NTP pyrophosphohydrolase [Curtobacterium sp. MCBD17_019]